MTTLPCRKKNNKSDVKTGQTLGSRFFSDQVLSESFDLPTQLFLLRARVVLKNSANMFSLWPDPVEDLERLDRWVWDRCLRREGSRLSRWSWASWVEPGGSWPCQPFPWWSLLWDCSRRSAFQLELPQLSLGWDFSRSFRVILYAALLLLASGWSGWTDHMCWLKAKSVEDLSHLSHKGHCCPRFCSGSGSSSRPFCAWFFSFSLGLCLSSFSLCLSSWACFLSASAAFSCSCLARICSLVALTFSSSACSLASSSVCIFGLALGLLESSSTMMLGGAVGAVFPRFLLGDLVLDRVGVLVLLRSDCFLFFFFFLFLSVVSAASAGSTSLRRASRSRGSDPNLVFSDSSLSSSPELTRWAGVASVQEMYGNDSKFKKNTRKKVQLGGIKSHSCAKVTLRSFRVELQKKTVTWRNFQVEPHGIEVTLRSFRVELQKKTVTWKKFQVEPHTSYSEEFQSRAC